MDRLSQRDLRALLGFLRGCYSIRNIDTYLTHTLAELRLLIPVALAGYCEMNPTRAKSKNWFDPPGVATPATDLMWEAHMQEHPVLSHVQKTGDYRALKISDFCSQREFQRTALYNEIYRRMGIEDVLCLAATLDRHSVMGIALHREKRSFTGRERLLLNLIRPHIIQARENALRVTQIENERRQLHQTLENLDQGVVVLSGVGRVLFMTARARQWLGEFFGEAALAHDKLPDTVRQWVRHQEESLCEAKLACPRTALVRDREGKRLHVRLVSGAGQSLLLLAKQVTAPAPSGFRDFGLSPREAEVLAWVTQGKTNSDIAAILNASPRTIQKHLEHVFQKLGVETRTAAAVWALEKNS